MSSLLTRLPANLSVRYRGLSPEAYRDLCTEPVLYALATPTTRLGAGCEQYRLPQAFRAENPLCRWIDFVTLRDELYSLRKNATDAEREQEIVEIERWVQETGLDFFAIQQEPHDLVGTGLAYGIAEAIGSGTATDRVSGDLSTPIRTLPTAELYAWKRTPLNAWQQAAEQVVLYALPSEDATLDVTRPMFVVPMDLPRGSRFIADSAPVPTLEEPTMLAGEVRAWRDALDEPAAKQVLDRVLRWIGQQTAPIIGYQLEPVALAGTGLSTEIGTHIGRTFDRRRLELPK